MKTKAQKKIEIEKGNELFKESHALVFSDFTNVPTKDLNRFRRELKKIGGNLLVLKKRLLRLVLKEKGVELDAKQFRGPIATIFSKPDVEEISGSVFRFFSTLEVPEGKEKNIWISHILGAYDIKEKTFVDAKTVTLLGKLPSREVVLAQVLGMLAAPIRALLYILSQKAASAGAQTETVPAAADTQPTQQETK